MNLYESSVTVNDGSGTVQVGNQTVGFGPEVLARFPGLGQYSGQRVIVGIRPEDFEDSAIATDTPPDRRLRGTAKLVEALGSELMVHFVLDDANTVNSGDPDAPEQELGEGISNAVARYSPRSHGTDLRRPDRGRRHHRQPPLLRRPNPRTHPLSSSA